MRKEPLYDVKSGTLDMLKWHLAIVKCIVRFINFLLLQKLTYKKAKQVPQNYKLFTNIGIRKHVG